MRESALFTPGTGGAPPHLAGRTVERAELATALCLLRKDRHVAYERDKPIGGGRRPFMLFGPRGMGKTVLLDWLAAECREQKTDSISITPDRALSSVADIPALLLPPPGKSKWQLKKFEFGAEAEGKAGAGTGVKGSVVFKVVLENSKGEQKQGLLTDMVIEACKGRPRAVLIDEAHEVDDKDVYRALFNTVQDVAKQAPLLLVMAGTPKLVDRTMTCGATFMERAEYRGLGRLDLADAMDALRIPLERNRVNVPETLLERMAEEGQCYPFFLQVWGAALWDAIRHEQRPVDVTQAHVDAARPAFEKERQRLYRKRYGILYKNIGLCNAAYAVALEFLKQGTGNLDLDELGAAIDASLADTIPVPSERATEARRLLSQLVDDDYIWDPLERPMEPSIPSFMGHIWSRRNPGVKPPSPEPPGKGPER